MYPRAPVVRLVIFSFEGFPKKEAESDFQFVFTFNMSLLKKREISETLLYSKYQYQDRDCSSLNFGVETVARPWLVISEYQHGEMLQH